MTETLTPDLCVVGAGAAGLSTAAIAASFGAAVVLVERGTMGGECLNAGCVPSKALLAAAEAAQARRASAPFGVRAAEPEVDMLAVREHVRQVIASIAPADSAERYAGLGVRVIRAAARFVDARTLEAGGVAIRPRRVVIASGSRPAIPPIPGLPETPHLTNETVFDLARRPRRLVVIGAGPVGMELAQAHRRFGAAVTLLSDGRALPREDAETAAIAAAALRAEGVDLREGVRVLRVEAGEDGPRVVIRTGEDGPQETIEGSHLLVATGRAPVVDGLGLEAAGIDHGPEGIRVDARLRTSNRRVFAIGDCATGGTGGLRLTHAANAQAGIVVRQALFRLPARFDPLSIPRVVYTDPEVASVGLSEEEAFARHSGVRVLRWPLAENDRARAERRLHGLVKVLTAKDGRVLGCAVAAPHAGELVAPWTLAIAKRLKAQDVAGVVMPYPTLSEISRRAAVEFVRPLAGSPWVRRWLRLAKLFG